MYFVLIVNEILIFRELATYCTYHISYWCSHSSILIELCAAGMFRNNTKYTRGYGHERNLATWNENKYLNIHKS